MKFKHKLEFNTTEELNAQFVDGNKTISDIIVDVALKNLKTKRKNIPVIQFTTKDDDLIYDVMIERHDMVETLEQNLDVMEEYEDYERCQKITDALHYLKINQQNK
jgi:hypothetical protein|tara:strand:- start:1369 stop:1686 length:318 start_codon:yes stop_codon:yes gene_type:complete